MISYDCQLPKSRKKVHFKTRHNEAGLDIYFTPDLRKKV